MRLPRIPALLITATCCLSGCCSFNGSISTDHAWVGHQGGVIQKGGPSQKGGVVQKGVVQKGVVQKGVVQKGVVQKGGVHQKGHGGHPHQKGVAQKGGGHHSIIHQNLWNHFEPTACCASWDPVLGSCDACGVCGGACQGHTPAQHLKHKLTCASGCGEIYWGDWINHPPAACDPCDDWGNWIGPNDCGGPSYVDTLASGWGNLFGYRNGGGKGKGGGGKGGCATCSGKGGCDHDGGGGPAAYYEDVPVGDANDIDAGAPTPEIEASNQSGRLPRGGTGFSIRSARFSR